MGMQVSPKMAIMSHLSDVQDMVSILPADEVRRQINIAKAILLHYSTDLETPVDEADINKVIAKYTRR